MAQYQKTVRPMFLQFIEPSKQYADIIVPRGGKNRIAIDILKAKISQFFEGNRQAAFIQPGFYIAITKTHGTLSFRASCPEDNASGQSRLSLNITCFALRRYPQGTMHERRECHASL